MGAGNGSIPVKIEVTLATNAHELDTLCVRFQRRRRLRGGRLIPTAAACLVVVFLGQRAMEELRFAGYYGATATMGDDAWGLPLDWVQCAGAFDVKRVWHRAKEPFLHLLATVVTYAAFAALLLPMAAEAEPILSAVVSAKYLDHLESLCLMGIVVLAERAQVRFTSGYFAVRKGSAASTASLARSIFSGRKLNQLRFRTPKGVNLTPVDEVLRKLAVLQAENRTATLYVLNLDWRHFFHQVRLPPEARRFFGLRAAVRRGEELVSQFFHWVTMPMGWSWAPVIAQSLSWGVLLHTERDCEREVDLGLDYDTLGKLSELPSHLTLSGGRGFVFLLYDNVLVVTTCPALRARWRHRIERNTRVCALEVKTFEAAMLSPSQCAKAEPSSFVYCGVEISMVEGRLGWRHPTEKLDRWRSTFEHVLSGQACRPADVAKVVGVAIWNQTIALQPLITIRGPIELLRRTAKSVGCVYRRWSQMGLVSLDPGELACLAAVWAELRANQWIRLHHEARTTVYAASDASMEKLAAVEFERDDCGPQALRYWFRGVEVEDHIFYHELAAAFLAVRHVLQVGKAEKSDIRIVLAVDNTAVAHAIRRGYSSTARGATIINEIFKTLKRLKSSLEIVSILSHANVADDPSRGRRPTVDRATRTWHVLMEYEAGHGKQDQIKKEYEASGDDGLRHKEPDEAPIPGEWDLDAIVGNTVASLNLG